MKAKGALGPSILQFVQDNYKEKEQEFVSQLPANSKKIYQDIFDSTKWYEMKDLVLEPTKVIGKMFFDDDYTKAAWESGYHSAQVTLSGIYKVFVMIATPNFIVGRATRILSSFYNPSNIIVKKSEDKCIVLHMTEFPEASDIVENRIGGWIQRALEICGCKSVQVSITKSLANNDAYTEYSIAWK